MRPFLDQLWRSSSLAMNRQEAKIFVGGLNWSTSEEKLRSYFENFGSVQEAFVSYDRHTGRPRGFGFVVFEDPLVADKVVSIQHTIDRREVTLELAFESLWQRSVVLTAVSLLICRWKPRRLFQRMISPRRAMEACRRNGHVKFLWGVWPLLWTSWPFGSKYFSAVALLDVMPAQCSLWAACKRQRERRVDGNIRSCLNLFALAQVFRAVWFRRRRCCHVRSRQQTAARVRLHQLLQ